MPNHVVGYAGRFDLLFVAVEQLLPHGLRTVISRRIWYPRYIRIGQQIQVHRVGFDCINQPFRHFSKCVLQPHLRHDQLGVKKVKTRFADRFYLLSRNLADLVVRQLFSTFPLHIFPCVLRYIRPLELLRQLSCQRALTCTLRPYDSNFIHLTLTCQH